MPEPLEALIASVCARMPKGARIDICLDTDGPNVFFGHYRHEGDASCYSDHLGEQLWYALEALKSITASEEEDGDDEILWNCAVCSLLIVDSLHCPKCGSCAPWGCGMDHEEDDEYEESDEFESGDDYEPARGM